MRTMSWYSASASRTVITVLLLTIYTRTAISIPQPLQIRQTAFAGLQLPQCALKCYVSSILTDGCVNEADFACHCAKGNIAEKAKTCIVQGCNKIEATDGLAKVRAACKALNGGGGGNGGSELVIGSSSAAGPTPTSEAPRASMPIASSPSASQLLSRTSPVGTPVTSQPPTSIIMSASRLSMSGSATSMPSSSPTEIPLAPLPPSSNQLSEGAKAGISISVVFVALSVFFALGWYIRRLKRDLHAAQAATRVSEDTWRSQMSTTTAPLAPLSIARSRSWTRGRRSSREDPVSPLSPNSMAEITTVTNNGYGVLKKKRGNVLSIVVEGSEEDGASLMDRSVREPVPGQREGLSGPLELDGEWTGVVEMPLAITPRSRSIDRDREGGRLESDEKG